MQGIFLLLRNDFKIYQYVLLLVKGFFVSLDEKLQFILDICNFIE